MMRTKREVRKITRWAKKRAYEHYKYEKKSMKLFRKFGLFDGFEYYGHYNEYGDFVGEDHIVVTDPMGEAHTYYIASDKKSYDSLYAALILELEIIHKHNKR